MIRTLIRCGVLAGAVSLSACDLEVRNPNQPETERVLATPADVESLLGSYYRRWHDGLYRTLGSVWGMANVQSFENVSSLSNNCQGQRVGIPRPANENSIGNVCSGEQSRVYFIHSEVTRVASNILKQLDTPPFTLGTQARDARARAFAEFLRGVSLGYLALVYDSAAVIVPGMSSEDAGELRPYSEVMDSAYVALQRSIDYANAEAANTNDGSDGFPLPATWIPSPTSFTATEFVRVVRSYRARFRANVARNPTERAAVNWDAVIADAQNGITADHLNITNSVNGPFKTWVAQYDIYGTWHQMTPFIIGMGDVSGSYAAWIAQALAERGSSGGFFMVTPDLRFPQGATRAAQQADFTITSCQAASTPCERYFVNRPAGGDQFVGAGWGWSNYDFVRFHSWRVAGDGTGAQNGPIVFFTKAELDLLEAEGHIRKSQYDLAAALINKTRTAGMAGNPPVATGGGLPAVAPTADGGLVGPDCVPKMPVNAGHSGGGTLTCGNLMEALKWEKRIEAMYTHFAGWFLDSRGWGDLAEGTPVHWAVPFEDLQARGRPTSAFYSTGVGTTGGGAAAKSGYGW